MRVDYERFTLDNGLTVLIHQDQDTDLVAVNTIYNVGARDEDPSRTGFAHLFEHLMFGGSKNIPDFDTPLQKVGGDNNAFTSNDITNYYVTLPAANLETALWLESDRMNELAFTPKSLEVQQSVVIEEFRQRYLNQPYGDVWLLLRPLVYKAHPYMWPTIGKEISHIEDATMNDVKGFFYSHYRPNNAVLTIAGNVNVDDTMQLVRKWYDDIQPGERSERNLPIEPLQDEVREESVERDVPTDALYMVYKMEGRTEDSYFATDLLSDVLGRGESSRLFRSLVKDNPMFGQLDCFVSADLDPGMFIVSGKLADGVQMDEAVEAVQNELGKVDSTVTESELSKVVNKAESTVRFGLMSVLDKAMGLSIAENMGNADLLNEELDMYRKVTVDHVHQRAQEVLRPENACILKYHARK